MKRLSCPRCGFVPRNQTGAYARRALTIHLCEKQLADAERQRRGAERRAAVDRTPQPCTHPVAEHQHGTRAAYVLDACRCLPCSEANAKAENERERQKAYGRYDVYTDAEPIREHLARLAAYGIGLKTVSKISGVSNGSLTKIVYGRYASVNGPQRGRYGAGDLVAGPARRVKRATAERLLAVQPVPANLPAVSPDLERTAQARLQLRALVALGWSMTKVGAGIGMTSGNFGRVIHGSEPMTRGTVDKVEALYARISMTLPPAAEHRERISVSRAKRYARERGWLPPLELEALIDPTYDALGEQTEDLPDEAVVTRRLDGDHSAPATKADRIEITRRGLARGWSITEIERRAGIRARDLPREDLAS